MTCGATSIAALVTAEVAGRALTRQDYAMTSRLVSSLLTAPLACLALSCSEPVPPASQGAFFLSFVAQSSVPNTECRVKGHQAQVGGVKPTEITDLKKDTVGGAQIFCVVSGSGTFDAEGTIQLEDRYLNFVTKGISTAATKDNPFKGALSYSSLTTAGSYSSSECNFYFEAEEQVDAGRIWMSFECPSISSGSDNSVCSINFGTIAMQNCEQ